MKEQMIRECVSARAQLTHKANPSTLKGEQILFMDKTGEQSQPNKSEFIPSKGKASESSLDKAAEPMMQAFAGMVSPSERTHLQNESTRVLEKANQELRDLRRGITAAEREEIEKIKKEVEANSEIDDKERIQLAERLLGRQLKDSEKEAILQAHNVGIGEEGKNRTEAAIGDYTLAQIREKTRILKEAELNSHDTAVVLEAGIAGRGRGGGGGVMERSASNKSQEEDEGNVNVRPKIKDTSLARSWWEDMKKRQLLERHKAGDKDIDWEGELLTPEEKVLASEGYLPSQAEQGAKKTEDYYITVLNTLQKATMSASNEKEFIDGVEQLIEYTDVLRTTSPDAYAQIAEYIDRLNSADTLGGKKAQIPLIVAELRNNYMEGEDSSRESLPESLDEVVEYIMKRAGNKWRRGGVRELITEINGEDQINFENFSAWIREQARFWRDFSPTNPQLNILGQVNVPMQYRPISLEEILTQSQYKRKSIKGATFDKTRTTEGVKNVPGEGVRYSSNSDYEKFLEDTLYEVFYYQVASNNRASYLQIMETDSKLPEQYAGLLADNTITRTDFFRRYFTLAASSKGNILNNEVDKNGKALEQNHELGELILKAYNVYSNLADIDTLKEVLGDDSVFFQKTYTTNIKNSDSLRVEDGKITGEQKKGLGNGWKKEWFDDSGKLKSDSTSQFEFMAYMNWYKEYKKDPRSIDEVRDRVRISLANDYYRSLKGNEELKNHLRKAKEKEIREKFNRELGQKTPEDSAKLTPDYFNEELSKRLEAETEVALWKFAYDDALDAEEKAFSLERWTGTGDQDYTYTGHDAGTKFYETAGYRQGQSEGPRAGGGVGSPKTGAIYKRLALPLLEGLKTLYTPKGKKEGKVVRDILNEMNSLQKMDESQLINKIVEVKSLIGGWEEDKEKELRKKLDEQLRKVDSDTKKPVLTREGLRQMALKEVSEQLQFHSNAAKDYMFNHYVKAAQTFDSLTSAEEFDLSKIVQLDPLQGFTFNRAEFIKLINEKAIKTERYRLRDIDVTRRDRFLIGQDENKKPIFKTVTVAEKMFGRQVLDRLFIVKKDIVASEDTTATQDIYDSSDSTGEKLRYAKGDTIKKGELIYKAGEINMDILADKGGQLWREALMLRFAADVAAHIDSKDAQNRWTNSQVDTFWKGLSSMMKDVKFNEHDFWNTDLGVPYFSPEEIKYMRTVSKTPELKIFMNDAGFDLGGGLAAGIKESFKKFFGSLSK